MELLPSGRRCRGFPTSPSQVRAVSRLRRSAAPARSKLPVQANPGRDHWATARAKAGPSHTNIPEEPKAADACGPRGPHLLFPLRREVSACHLLHVRPERRQRRASTFQETQSHHGPEARPRLALCMLGVVVRAARRAGNRKLGPAEAATRGIARSTSGVRPGLGQLLRLCGLLGVGVSGEDGSIFW